MTTPTRERKLVSAITTLSFELNSKNREIAELKAEAEKYKKMYGDANNRLCALTKQKSRVDKSLSGIVKQLYPSLPADKRFKVNEQYNSDENKKIRDNIEHLIREQNSSFDAKQINTAIHSRYSMERRRVSNKENQVEVTAYNRRVARRHMLFERRVKVARSRNLHSEIFAKLGPADMSDLEDNEQGGLTAKRPILRPAEVTNAIREIDGFLKERQRKSRTIGSPSTRSALNTSVNE